MKWFIIWKIYTCKLHNHFVFKPINFSCTYLFYRLKLVDSISTYSDYDFQVILIEAVFRLYGKTRINEKLKDIIPESQELSQSFGDISPETFDEDVRLFLNALNKNSGKIFSIICQNIKIENILCGAPMVSISYVIMYKINTEVVCNVRYLVPSTFKSS